MTEMDLDELRAELDDFAKPEKRKPRSPREERIIAGFEEIQKFVEEHGRSPAHGEDNDIFERIYATRLDQIRRQKECRNIVAELDHQGLLEAEQDETAPEEDLSDEELLSELGGLGPPRKRCSQAAPCKITRGDTGGRRGRQPYPLRRF